MGKIILCGNCEFFKPNGKYKRLYPGEEYTISAILPKRMGICQCPIEPPYGRYKNEYNTCDNCILRNGNDNT